MSDAPFQFASAVSTLSDAARAAEEAVEQVLPRITGPVDLAVLFVSPHHRAQLEEVEEYLSLTLRPRTSNPTTCPSAILRLTVVRGCTARTPGAALEL